MPTLTVCFIDPWWVGILEVADSDQTLVGRFLFGSEPSTPEVLQLVLDGWDTLLAVAYAPLANVEKPKALGNPKRRARAARKLLAEREIGTQAQIAIKQAQAAHAKQRSQQTREQRELAAEQAWQKRQNKHKAKRRGH